MSIRNNITGDFLYYLNEGKVHDAYKTFGAHLVKNEKGENIGCEFLLYAPNARQVNIIGEWNNFEGWKSTMQKIDESGVWYFYLEGNMEWKRYKYEIKTKQGDTKYKADPYAMYSDLRPSTDSKIYDFDGYTWHDDEFLKSKKTPYDKPVNVYEMHIGSWKRKDNGDFYTFAELVPLLIPYLKENGFTHVEFMPIYEHPLDASWGYQGVSYYSPTARFGVPKDFMYLVDELHKAGLYVIMDWVPGHICKDAHGLYLFDGTALYDYPDPSIRENVEWGTANLDLGKGYVRSFLYSNALYYMKEFHVDGFRIDAVSNLIYYLGNPNRGVNEGACDFLRELSCILFAYDETTLLMAEDSSAHDGVTRPVAFGGLGFNYKWDMGWMNDTLKYFKLDPIYRKYHHHQLTFSMVYNYNEQFILPLSHDEVVHMKGSLLNKMPGDYWQQFANFRLLMAYMYTHPGKKLLFMGSELAPYSEWHFEGQLDWHLHQFPSHDSASRFVKELNFLYQNEPALYELDHSPEGFKWIEPNNADQSVYIYARYGKKKNDHIVVVMNATPNTYHDYMIGVPGENDYYEIMNSDTDIYGGSNQINPLLLKNQPIPMHGLDNSINITVPPLGIAMFKMKKKTVSRNKKK